jgi:hypothetical protein
VISCHAHEARAVPEIPMIARAMPGVALARCDGMACPLFFERGHRCRCLAVIGDAVPTLHERETFCWNNRHAACPTFTARQRAGRPLTEEQYLAQWMGAAPAPPLKRAL